MAHSWVNWDPITPLLQHLPIFQHYTVSGSSHSWCQNCHLTHSDFQPHSFLDKASYSNNLMSKGGNSFTPVYTVVAAVRLSIAYTNQRAVPHVWSLLTAMINSRKLWLHSMIRSQESATAAGTFPQVTPGWQYIGWGKHLPMDIGLERPWRLKLDREFPTFILAMVSSWREKWSIRPLHKSLRNTLAPFCHVSVAFFFSIILKYFLLSYCSDF